MRKRKWFIPVVVVSVLMIGGVTGGVLAADDSSNSIEGQGQSNYRYQAFLDRVCAIYEENTGVSIDSGQLKDAVAQVRIEIREQAVENWLQDLVKNGKITEEEAGQYLEWWQSRPDIELPLPRFGGPGSGSGLIRDRVFQFLNGHCHVSDGPPETTS